MKTTDQDLKRYSRHILLDELGEEGQTKISEGRVLIVGAGGLGSPAALYLAAAGVGTIGLADQDNVDISNLQRQVIHFTDDVGKEKTLSAKEKIEKLNPAVVVKTYREFLSVKNILPIIRDYDFILDCTDNFAAKYLINDIAVKEGKGFSHGSMLRFSGQAMTYKPGNACYRCLFPQPPAEGTLPSSAEVGVFGPAVGLLGTIQATEAIKFLIGKGDLLTNRLLNFNALDMTFKEIPFTHSPTCPTCCGTF